MANTGQEDALAGATLDGRWEILERLAEERDSVLYSARQIATGRDVWVRVIPGGPAPGTERFDTWMSAVRSAVSLRHPNTLATHGSGATSEGAFYVVTDPLEGESLRGRLDREGRLSLEEAAQVLSEVCLSLTEAHSIGVYHGDLCARTIHVSDTEEGFRVQVADYGAARLLSPAGRPETESLPAIDPGEYRAPELDEDEENTSARSDIYSLAVVLFEALSGRRGREGRSWVSSLWDIQQGRPVPLVIDNLLAGALARSPAARIPSAGLFRERLLSALEGGPLSSAQRPLRRLKEYRTALETLEEEEEANSAADRARAIAAAQKIAPENVRLRRHKVERIILLTTIGVLLISVALMFHQWPTKSTAELFLEKARSGNGPSAPPARAPGVSGQEAGADSTAPATPGVASEGAGRACPVPLRLETEPSGAEVRRGDEILGTAPLEMCATRRGERSELLLSAPGHEARTFTVVFGEKRIVEVALTPAASPDGPDATSPPPDAVDDAASPSEAETLEGGPALERPDARPPTARPARPEGSAGETASPAPTPEPPSEPRAPRTPPRKTRTPKKVDLPEPDF